MSLSEKITYTPHPAINLPFGLFFEIDVREAVKELKRRIDKQDCYCDDLDENNYGLGFTKACDTCAFKSWINEIFGEKLT